MGLFLPGQESRLVGDHIALSRGYLWILCLFFAYKIYIKYYFNNNKQHCISETSQGMGGHSAEHEKQDSFSGLGPGFHGALDKLGLSFLTLKTEG